VSKSLVLKLRLKVLNSSAERQLCHNEFQTEGALTLKAQAIVIIYSDQTPDTLKLPDNLWHL